MKNIIFRDVEKILTIEDINNFSKEHNLNLPVDYIQHLLNNNGGYPEKSTFPLIQPIGENINKGSDARASWFLAIYDDEYENLAKTINLFKDRMPKDLIPIITTEGGNYICLCVNGINYGKVYYWDHNWEAEDGKEPSYDNVYLIANSFTDFINSLYKFDIEMRTEQLKEGEVEKHIYTYDKYSLPFSTHIKKYDSVVSDFFRKAPNIVGEYIIKDSLETKDIVLSYEYKGKKYQRIIKEDGQIIDSVN